MSSIRPVIVGDFSYKPTKEDGKEACFYFIEGNVLFIFDLNETTIQSFTDNTAMLRGLREVVCCFSGRPGYAVISKLIQTLIKGLRVAGANFCKVRSICVDTKSQVMTCIHDEYEVIELDPRDTTNTFIETNRNTILIQPFSQYNHKGFTSFSVWKQEPTWCCVLFYNGYDGGMDESTIAFLEKNPRTDLVFYINHELFGRYTYDIRDLYKILNNSFSSLENDVHLLGYRSSKEAEYIRSRFKK